MHHLVFGCNGPVGHDLMIHLRRAGHEVTGVCRSGRAKAPGGVRIEAGDARDRERAAALARGVDVIHSAIGIDYAVWQAQWMPIVEGLLHAARKNAARLVFADNLYAYGPRNEPLREDMALTGFGRKPALRARMTERLLGAHERGEAEVVLVRASDFFGPRVRNAMLGERVFGRILRGQPAQVFGRLDLPHAFTYAGDFARALALVSTEQSAYGRPWHVPNPPTRTPREILTEIAALAGQPLRVSVLPRPLIPVLGWFLPVMRELDEMMFQWTRPYEVDTTAFATRFAFTPTAWEPALRATLAWYGAEGARSGKTAPDRTPRRS